MKSRLELIWRSPAKPGLTCALALALLSLGGLAAEPEHGTQPDPGSHAEAPVPTHNGAAAPRLGEPINDHALLRFLEAEGPKLAQTGCTLTNWGGSLGARSCKLKLPSRSNRKSSVAEVGRRMETAVGVVGTVYLCTKCSKLHTATASGFFLSDSGAFVTSRHVLANYREQGRGIVVLTRGGRLCGITGVLASDPLNDLVVLQVSGRGFACLPLAAEAPEPGSSVTVLSHPGQHFYVLTSGIVGREEVSESRDGLRRWLTITADFAKGSSGAPVCDPSGNVIGLVNNTESIYYTTDNNEQKNLQMVLKNCTPAGALRRLVIGP